MPDSPPTFEQALQRLEAIVHELEEGQVGLEESLARYEEGVEILRRCYVLLQQAEKRVELITGLDAEGNPLTAAFDATASAERKANADKGAENRRSAAAAPRAATTTADPQADADGLTDRPAARTLNEEKDSEDAGRLF